MRLPCLRYASGSGWGRTGSPAVPFLCPARLRTSLWEEFHWAGRRTWGRPLPRRGKPVAGSAPRCLLGAGLRPPHRVLGCSANPTNIPTNFNIPGAKNGPLP